MATGLRIPIQVNDAGGASRDSKDSQLSKLIGQALADGDNDNAFQEGEIGIQDPPVFAINDRASLGKMRLVAQKVMKRFEAEERAKLKGIKIFTLNNQDPNDPAPVKLKEGEAILSIEYINLETQQPSTFIKKF